jgi:hypothetical protein
LFDDSGGAPCLYGIILGLLRESDLPFAELLQYLGLLQRFESLVSNVEDERMLSQNEGYDLAATRSVFGKCLCVVKVALSQQGADIPIDLRGIVGVAFSRADPDSYRRFRNAPLASDQHLFYKHILTATGVASPTPACRHYDGARKAKDSLSHKETDTPE